MVEASNSGERPATEGESPVIEIVTTQANTLSTAGHEKSGRNQPGPPGKAKYSQVTDSEPVP